MRWGHGLSSGLVGTLAWAVISTAPAAAAPRQDQCPAVAAFDLHRLKAGAGNQTLAWVDDQVALAVVPDISPLRPSASAPLVVRLRAPAHDIRAVVWRETDGGWWFWRQYVDRSPRPPPLPPPPGEENVQRAPPTFDELYPPTFGRLSDRFSAIMEAAYQDPCRALEPDVTPPVIPLRRRENGTRTRICPPDSTPYAALITEVGRPARRIFLACDQDTSTGNMVRYGVSARTD